MQSYPRELQIVAPAFARNLRNMKAMSASCHGSDGEDDYEANQHLLDIFMAYGKATKAYRVTRFY